MTRNLPPGVSVNDPDAPWNQRHPEPNKIDIRCSECDWTGMVAESDYDGLPHCPRCDKEIDKDDINRV